MCAHRGEGSFSLLSLEPKKIASLYRSSLVAAEWDADCTSIPSSLPKIRGLQLQTQCTMHQNCDTIGVLSRHASTDRRPWSDVGPLALLSTLPPAGFRALEASRS